MRSKSSAAQSGRPQAFSTTSEGTGLVPVPFLRLPQVKALTGMSRSWIYAAIQRGAFPAPVRVGERAVAWSAASVAEWQASRMKASVESSLQ